MTMRLPVVTMMWGVLALPLVFGGCGSDPAETSTGTETGDGDGDPGDGDGDPGDGDGDPGDPIVYPDDPPESYTRVDRMGMPAVATAVITSKDAYNQANPADDAAGDFVTEITTNVTALHAALDDDLVGVGLVSCEPADCLTQAAPLVLPDTLKIDLEQPAGFPNGRRLSDQVVDITLAVLLLDLNTQGQDATLFTNVPLNPPANDLEFLSEFPYLAAPH